MIRRHNDCLTRCVGYCFRENPNYIPLFIEHKDWIKRLKRFYERRGQRIWHEPFRVRKLKAGKLYIVCGLSWRSTKKKRIYHAVVYRGRRPLYDPHCSGKFLKGRPIYFWNTGRYT